MPKNIHQNELLQWNEKKKTIIEKYKHIGNHYIISAQEYFIACMISSERHTSTSCGYFLINLNDHS